MFRRAPGCMGVVMAGDDDRRSVTTIWRSAEEHAAFEDSAAYAETVRRIMAEGLLDGMQAITVEPVQLAWAGGAGGMALEIPQEA